MPVHLSDDAARPAGLLLGVLADAVLADPRRWHPVAGFGRWAGWLEHRMHRDGRAPGVAFTASAMAPVILGGALAERWCSGRPLARMLATAAATWTVLGGTSLAREGRMMARLLDGGELEAARRRLSHLCARDATGAGPADLARATVESLAENTSDAVVAPLVWGAVGGVPGLLGYRAVNTLDAMVGYRSPRHRRFGWASARLDDVANLIPARVCGALVAVAAPVVSGSPQVAWRVMLRDARAHPSPNAGWPEAAAAGALGVSLGGENTYPGYTEARPVMGTGPAPGVGDVRRAVRLCSSAGIAAAGLCAGIGALIGRSRPGQPRRTLPGVRHRGPGPGIGS